MALSSDLISQFVQVTKDEKTKRETTAFGTIVEHDGAKYVRLDGSELLTPISTTADVLANERVLVTIKNHSAIVTGNISSPSARTGTVNEINERTETAANKITELEIVVADKVSTDRLEVEVARIDNLVSENVTIKGRLDTNEGNIKQLNADNVTVNKQLTAAEADIEYLKSEVLDIENATVKFATIENLEATQAQVNSLEATYGEFHDLTVTRLDTAEADIDSLETNKLDVTTADVKYANIDFANINMTAVKKLFSDSGIIKDLVVSDGKITGELVGVTIKGDLIEGNTIVADKLVVKGENGLYYKLNTDGVVTEAEQTDYNSLKGSVIQAKSITAEKIAVDDLVAFGATIGGLHIAKGTLYSGTKNSVSNATCGLYFDSNGQANIGDGTYFVKYYKNTDGTYKLAISANEILLDSKPAATTEEVDRAQQTADSAQQTANDAESLIKQLSDSISMLVTDGNGTSLMTQTDDGWAFSTSEIQNAVDATSEGLDALVNELGSTNGVVDVLKQAVDDLGILADYITIGTYDGEPCIELGESDSEFKLRITNTRIMFMEGSSVPAYFTNQSMHIKKAVVEEELQQGGFIWKVRNNGNMGLVWKGVSS